jgi:hypothetical protein
LLLDLTAVWPFGIQGRADAVVLKIVHRPNRNNVLLCIIFLRSFSTNNLLISLLFHLLDLFLDQSVESKDHFCVIKGTVSADTDEGD